MEIFVEVFEIFVDCLYLLIRFTCFKFSCFPFRRKFVADAITSAPSMSSMFSFSVSPAS